MMKNRLNNLPENDSNREKAIKSRQNEGKVKEKEKFRVNNKNFHFFTYFLFVVIRIVLVFIPQYGYIHPDEFFQTTEVINGKDLTISKC